MDHSAISDYMPHGFCFLWEPGLVWLHIISDALSGISYYAIAIALFYFIFKRSDLPFLRIFVLFGVFILSCGSTHFFAIYTLYIASYWEEGIVKAITAVVSVISAILFIPMIPKAIALPSLTKALEDIRKLNIDLKEQLAEKDAATKAARESEEKYRSLFENIQDGIYRTDIKGNISVINPAGAKILGYNSTDEVIGQSVIQHWESHTERDKFIETLIREDVVHNYPVRGLKKDGRGVLIELSAKALMDEDGSIRGVEGIMRDVTEQKQLEAQLYQSQRMEVIGHLAGGVAHDFNNILSAIIGYTSLIKKNINPEDKLKSYVTEIDELSLKAANLTKSLLAFSRKQVFEIKNTDINELVFKMHKILERIIGEDIRLISNLAPGKLIAKVDPGQIEQVLMNLVMNGRDAMPDGGILSINTMRQQITKDFISDHRFGEAGSYALIEVSDSGIGMDEKTKEHIFEPFFTTKEVGKGTGLGLSMVYGIVKQHNGFINVYSELNVGTTFKIYLPMAETNIEEKDVKEHVPEHKGSETILLVEDDSSVMRITKKILEEYGYHVLEASDGEEALKVFSSNIDRINLILTDLVMPKKNGKQLFEAARALRHDIKVLFTSGYAAEIIGTKGLLAEGMNFISKPIDPDNMLVKIREILDTDDLAKV